VDANGVRPIEIRVLGVADREMTGEAVVKAVHGKRAHGSDQMLFPILALFAGRGE